MRIRTILIIAHKKIHLSVALDTLSTGTAMYTTLAVMIQTGMTAFGMEKTPLIVTERSRVNMKRALILDIWMVMQMRFAIQMVQNLRRWIRLSFNL